MSESEGCAFDCTCIKCKGKKRVIRIEETSDSDSPVENATKRRKVTRVMSDGADSSSSGSSQSDSFNLSTRRKKLKKTLRMMSDEEDSSPLHARRHRNAKIESESGSDSSSDDGVGDDESEDFESGSEYDSDYEGESGHGSDWESDWESESGEDEVEERRPESKAGITSLAAAGFDSDSSDGQSEKCPICLRSFHNQEVGQPEACEHNFCAVCLEEWARNINTCPVDRQTFTRILVSDILGGKVVRRVEVSAPEPRDAGDDILEDPTFCERCQLSDREDRMLLCDSCDSGYHLDCLDPPLENVPIEQWFCPECVSSENMADEVDVMEGELNALVDEAHELGFPHPRPRVHRLLPRTRQSERVRATIRSRLTVNQPSTSSGIESLDSTGRLARCFGERSSNGLPAKRRRKTKTRRRRRTVKRKTKKGTSTKRKVSTTTTKKTTVKKKTTTAAGKKTKRKTKRKRKYVRRRKTRKPPRVSAAHRSVKSRLAEQLGLRAPRNAGQLLPEVRVKQPTVHGMPGMPTLHLFGHPDQLDYFSSGSDIEGDMTGGAAVSAMSRPRTSAARNERNLANRKLLSPGAIRSHSTVSDLVSGILESQAVWHSKKAKVSINRDRSITVVNDGKPPSHPIPSQDAPVNVKDATAAGKQTPMYPGRGNDGDGRGRPPPSGFQQFNTTHRYTNAGSFQGGNQPFAPPDFRENRIGYSDFLRGGPVPFRGNSPPVRFRMPQRFPLRPPFQRRPGPTPQPLTQPPEDKTEEGGWKSNNEDDDDGEEDEVDIYSDIEVTGAGPAEFESLPPPPLPPAQLMGLADQPVSEDDSDTELIIDDKASSPAPVAESEKYDPAEPSSDVEDLPNPTAEAAEEITLSSGSNSSYPSPTYDDSNSQADLAISKAVQEVLKVHLEASCSANDDRASSSQDGDDDDDKCPNFTIYSAASMDIARNTDSDPRPDNSNEDPNKSPCQDDPVKASVISEAEQQQVEMDESQIVSNTIVDLEALNKEDLPVVDPPTEKLVAEIFGSDEESLVGGATSPVSAVSSAHTPPHVAHTGLEGLDTEAISETEEAIHFDELSEASFATVDEEKSDMLDDVNVKEAIRDPLDYEEGEIVDEAPKKKEKKKEETEKKEPEKKVSDENVDTTKKQSKSSEDEKRKKKKKSTDKGQSKERAVLGSKENKEKSKTRDRDKSNKEDPNIAWKKPSKAKERNYRDGKEKEKAENKSSSKDASKKSSTVTKDKDSSSSKKEKDRKKKDKRQDMERYNVRKMVTNKKRTKRRDAFGRDLSRDRSYTRSRSRSRVARSRSLSKTRSNRDLRRSPAKAKRKRSRSISRRRSRSKSRHRSRSKSPVRSKNRTKSKDRLKKSRSRERTKRYSPDRSRTRKHTRSKSRSRKRSRVRTRTRSPLRSRGRVDPVRSVPRARRTLSRSWTPSWSRSGSATGSSFSRSRSSSVVQRFRSYSRSYSRSWTPDPGLPVANKKSTINKTAKKLTVTVSNTKETQKKKEKKKKILKKKEALASVDRRKKRKDKSPAPSKEVFTSGDNILVSVNFNKSSKQPSKDLGTISGMKDMLKRTMNDDGGNSTKKPRKDKGKEKALPKGAKGIQSRLGAKKVKKNAAPKLTRVQAAAKRKPMAIIDLDQSPFREQTPSPQDLIILSDSDDDAADKEAAEKRAREQSASPKGSSKAGTNTATNVSESQSPVMSNVGSYLVTSTGPKTPPEPQIKFSIAAKATLRSIMNPLQEEEDEEEGDDVIMDNIDLRIEEELNRSLGEGGHKGPNTPPEPRGPSTPCFSPSSPDAYDPFDPTKSGTPSPAEPEPNHPSPAPSPTPILNKDSDIREEPPKQPELESTPTEKAEQEKQPECPSNVDSTSKSPAVIESPLPPPPEPPLQLQELESPKQPIVKQPIVVIPEPETISPERSTPILTTPVKQFIVKPTSVAQLQPAALSVVTVASPVFPALTSANIATMLRTPPPPMRVNLFSQPPPVLPHHLFMSSPQRPPLTPDKKAKLSPLKPSPQKSTPIKSMPLRSQNGDKDKSTDVVDMDLESPYSPASSEANDLFEPPVDLTKHPSRMAAKKAPQHKSAGKGDIFDVIFGSSPLRSKRPVRGAAKPLPKKQLLPKKQAGKGKKEIGIKMNEDKLQILDELPSSAVELQVKDKYLKKLNRQERVVEEVKLSLKPHYAKKHITKEEYKDILRRSVPKICHNRSGEINPIKIASLVEAYVKKARYSSKKKSNSSGKTKSKQMWS